MTIKELVFVDNLHGIWFADAGCFGRYYISEFRRINGECVDYHCSFVDHSTNGSQSIPSKFRLVQWERALRECQAHYENLVEQHLDVPPDVSRDCPACHAAAVRKVNHCGNCNRVSEIE